MEGIAAAIRPRFSAIPLSRPGAVGADAELTQR
jgi:hypothetical protein